jgi:predicted dehydrogenase
MPKENRIGLIGLDTSHAPAFTRLLNNPQHQEHIPGGKVVAAFPGGSKDFELSWSRVEGFKKELRDQHGVEMMDSPEAVAEAVDLVFITAADGRVHREYLEQTLRHKRPTFIDKPFTHTSSDAREMFRLADQAGVPLMSCSSLRYADSLTDALKAESAPIVGCDVFGPMAEQPTQPGLFWYGVHMVEMVLAIMGTGCRRVQAMKNDDFDLVAAEWSDGRLASIRGARRGQKKFGATIHREETFQTVNASQNRKSYYANMLEAILRSLPNGKSDVPKEQTLEIVRLIEAANESRQSGKPVTL